MVLRRKLGSKHPTAEEDETREHSENRLSYLFKFTLFFSQFHT